MSDIRKEARLAALKEVVQLMGDIECEGTQAQEAPAPPTPPELSPEDAAVLSRVPEEE